MPNVETYKYTLDAISATSAATERH